MENKKPNYKPPMSSNIEQQKPKLIKRDIKISSNNYKYIFYILIYALIK